MTVSPTAVPSSPFAALGLHDQIVRALVASGYETPTPIQARTIPLLLEGRDLLGIAQTGTGKTAAFALPILHFLHTNPRRVEPRRPRALVLAPTRELASQILEACRKYGTYLPLRHDVVYGGVGMGAQIKSMQKGLDILIATPGRLLDLMQQRQVDLSRIEILVLDEADRMLDMGFIRDVER
ncbi:MAG: DEAD/DEAH box helicase, partial [Planctomycetota bacterium]